MPHVNLAKLQIENQSNNLSVSSENVSIHSSSHSECEVSVHSQSMQSYSEMQQTIEGDIQDEVIAEIISGEAEVLKDHNVIG